MKKIEEIEDIDERDFKYEHKIIESITIHKVTYLYNEKPLILGSLKRLPIEIIKRYFLMKIKQD